MICHVFENNIYIPILLMSKQIQMRRKRGREWPIKNNGEFIILELISAAGAGWLPAGCLAAWLAA